MDIPLLVLLHGTLGIFILVVASRVRRTSGLDFLRVTTVVYGLCFVVAPLYVCLAYVPTEAASVWWWLLDSQTPQGRLYAGVLAWIGFLAIAGGYSIAGLIKVRPPGRDPESAHRVYYRRAATLLAAVGVFAFVLYAVDAGGIGNVFEQSMVLRSVAPGTEVSRLAFLKNVSPLIEVASFFFFGLYRSAAKNKRGMLRWAFAGTFIASLGVLFHLAGRLALVAYVATFPVAVGIEGGRVRKRTMWLGAVAALLFLIVGKQVFNALVYPEGLAEQWRLAGADPKGLLGAVILEFAFPFAVLGQMTGAVPQSIPFRWFIDFPLAVAYALPDPVLPQATLPNTASVVVSDYIGVLGIPADMLSMGFMTAGVGGVIVLSAIFGVVLRVCDGYFRRSARHDSLRAVMGAAWLFFLAFRVMYGDPLHWIISGFHLAVGSAIIRGRSIVRHVSGSTVSNAVTS